MRTGMRHKVSLSFLAAAFVVLPALLLAPRLATGTESAMLVLPAYDRYRCAICHTSATPVTGDAALNGFGDDFKTAGNVWTPELAAANSDGDRCTNGFEIGDRNGDGVLDDPATQNLENSNPGDPNDCTVPVDRRTWGIIKDMFRSDMQQFSAVEEPDVWFLAYSP